MNVNKKICEEIKNQIDTQKPNELTEKLFESLSIHIKVNLSDTFSRLMFTNGYILYEQRKKYQKESFEGK